MEESKARLKELLRELTGIHAVSGHEYHIIGTLLEKLKPHVDSLHVGPLGNIYALKKGRSEGPTLMVVCHSDEIGLIVKNILPSGFILFEAVGGVPDNILPGRKVYIGQHHIPGIIGVKPGHLQTGEEAKKVTPAAQCYVDVGAFSRKEVEDLGIGIGDQMVLWSEFTELANPDLVSTKAVDNRIGCSIVIELMNSLAPEDFAGTLVGVVSIREEMGLYGAEIAGDTLEPDYAIVVDTIPAGDTPDVDREHELPVGLGQGPALPVAAGVGYTFASVAHPAVLRIIEEQAKNKDIPLQKLTLMGAQYATDADKVAYAGKGIPTGTLAIPRRYSHSPVELLHMEDAARTLTLLQAIVRANRDADLRFYKPQA